LVAVSGIIILAGSSTSGTAGINIDAYPVLLC